MLAYMPSLEQVCTISQNGVLDEKTLTEVCLELLSPSLFHLPLFFSDDNIGNRWMRQTCLADERVFDHINETKTGGQKESARV
jgi:hypothetical protein